nr:BamA/TamA family outer membrane protein [uncultured Desulfobacter sp.]
MTYQRNIMVWLVFFITVLSSPCFGNDDDTRKAEAKSPANRALNLPYAFYNENFGLAVGYAYGIYGFPQRQAALVATAMAGHNGSAMGFLMATDILLPWSKRLFLDPIISIGYFNEADAYIDGNPDFAGHRSGSNDSDKDNFVNGDGWDNYFRMRFKYLLPIGHGKTQIIPDYVLENGFLKSGASGGTSLNPFKSGRSFFELRPFYRNQQIDGNDIDAESKTNGLDFVLFWDNRDFPLNPTKGNAFRLKVSRDFGILDSSNSWTSIESEVDLYLPLGSSDWFRQRVFAFDVWTSYSPTWDEKEDQTITGRPPAYSGATLGGLLRMKGFASQRFSDKAAIYYSAEMRLTPKWNPFESWPWLQRHVGVQWVQFAPFVEIGRVAPSWNLPDLHSDLKWCAGLAARAFAKGLVVRMDSAASEDGVNVQMMINYPFQF